MMTALLLALAVLVDPPPVSEANCRVEVQVAPERGETPFGEYPSVVATVRNRGEEPITLVMPGDGSQEGDRTPILTWFFVPDPGATRWARCGNMSLLHAGEVFTLAPNESHDLGPSVRPTLVLPPGDYEAFVMYENEPGRPFLNASLSEEHDLVELERVRHSTPCRAVSNTVRISVLQPDLP